MALREVTVVTGRHRALISELVSLMGDDDRATCQSIVDCLLDLGYVPQRQKVQGYVLSFRNHQVGQTIAKIGAFGNDDRRAFFSIKFYACKQPPQKYLCAVGDAIRTSNKQYRCCGCGACGADEADRGYRHMYPEDDAFIRCGAYVVRIPDLKPGDADDVRRLLLEQHQYFLTRTG